MQFESDPMIDKLKPGDVIEVPLWCDDAIKTVSAELLPRLIVWFYDGTNLEAPPIKGIATVDEAIRIVHQRYPTAQFAESLSPEHVSPVDDTMDRDVLSIVIPFYGPEAGATYNELQAPGSPVEPSTGIVEWFVKLKR